MSTLEPPARVKNRAVSRSGWRAYRWRMAASWSSPCPIWLILLFLLPFLIVFKISPAEMARAIPPYTDLWEGRRAADADRKPR